MYKNKFELVVESLLKMVYDSCELEICVVGLNEEEIRTGSVANAEPGS